MPNSRRFKDFREKDLDIQYSFEGSASCEKLVAQTCAKPIKLQYSSDRSFYFYFYSFIVKVIFSFMQRVKAFSLKEIKIARDRAGNDFM